MIGTINHTELYTSQTGRICILLKVEIENTQELIFVPLNVAEAVVQLLRWCKVDTVNDGLFTEHEFHLLKGKLVPVELIPAGRFDKIYSLNYRILFDVE